MRSPAQHPARLAAVLLLALARPAFAQPDPVDTVTATDGLFEDRIEIAWTGSPAATDVVTIERNGVLLAGVAPSLSSYDDRTGVPGTTYTYCVIVQDAAGSTAAPVCDTGQRKVFKPTGFNASDGTDEAAALLQWTDRSTIEDGYTLARSGGHALAFDGTDDHLITPATDLTAGFTFAFWAQRTGTNGDFIVGQGTQVDNQGLQIGFAANKMQLDFRGNLLETAQTYTDTGWHHWTFTYNATTRARAIYRDGVLVASDVASAAYAGSGALHFGQKAWGIAQFEGALDEVQLWSRPLAADEVPPLMTRLLRGSEAGLKAYWPLDAGSGLTAYDAVGTLTGTLMDGATWVDTDLDELRAVLAPNASAFTDATTTPGTAYEYVLAAYVDADDDDVYTPGVDYVSVVAVDEGWRAFVAPPEAVSATDGRFTDRVQITWADQSAAETGFTIYRDGAEVGTVEADGTSYDDVPPQSLVAYTYCVTSTENGLESVQVCDPGTMGGLAGPADVAATVGTFDDRVAVTWQDVAGSEDGFEVARDGVVVGVTAANATTFNDTGAVQSQDHEYCVRAFSEADPDNTSYSAALCADGRRAAVLAPTNVAATDADHEDRAEISWRDASTTAMLFNLYRDGTLIQVLPPGQPLHADAAIASDVDYSYCVAAVTVPGAGAGLQAQVAEVLAVRAGTGALDAQRLSFRVQQQEAAARTDAVEQVVRAAAAGTAGLVASAQVCDTGSRSLAPPTDVAATYDEHETHVQVTWQDASSVEDGYRIYRQAGGSASEELAGEIGPNRTSYGDYAGTPGVAYTYRVRAYDERGPGGESAHSEDGGFRKIKAPTVLQASDGAAETEIDLSWQDNTRAETGYEVWRDGLLLTALPANTTRYTDAAVDFGATHSYSVSAIDDHGASLPAEDDGFTTILAPTSVSASTTYPDDVVVTWVDASGIEDAYRIDRDGQPLADLAADATSYTDATALPGVTYTYCVTAAFAGSASAPACADGAVPTPDAALGRTIFELGNIHQASDPAADDDFGASVAVDGRYAIIGALDEDAKGSNAGAAYVFKRIDGAWVQQQKILASDGATNDRFGQQVSISGDYAAVGASGEGAVYVFKRNGETWVQQAKITAADDLGDAVAIEGEYLVAGASGANSFEGAAYIFKRDGSSWPQVAYLTGTTTDQKGSFGTSVAIDGDDVIVGAIEDFVGSVGWAGAAYVFHNDPDAGWVQQDRLVPSDPGFDNWFGSSVSISGDYAAVSTNSDDELGQNFGAFYIFKRTNGAWSQQAKLFPHDPGALGFGVTVALYDDVVVAGSALDESKGTFAGAAYLYKRVDETWQEIAKVLPGSATGNADDQESERFGSALALEGSAILFGGFGFDDGRGAFYALEHLDRAGNVAASDGTYDERIQVTWTDANLDEGGYNVYRRGADGLQLVATTAPDVEIYNDFSIAPGSSYDYCVAPFNNELAQISDVLGEATLNCDVGWRPTNGSISGRVAALGGGGTEDVAVCLAPNPNRALLLDGDGGYVRVPDLATDTLTAFTVETWIRTNRTDGDNAFFSYATAASDNTILLIDPTDLQVFVLNNNTSDTGVALNDDQWHHLAVTWESATGEVTIYKDGAEAAVVADIGTGAALGEGGVLILGQEQDVVGGAFNVSQAFGGQLDEVRLWNHARTPDQIQAAMHQLLTGQEAGLVGYWPFDQGVRRTAPDLTGSNLNGTLVEGAYWSDAGAFDLCAPTDLEGNYTLDNLHYGTETTFTVTPTLDNRSFEPAFKKIRLNTDVPVQNQVDFVDNTSFTVAGTIRFDGTTCPVPDVELYVDDVLKGATESDGSFALAADPSAGATDLRRVEPRLIDTEDAGDRHLFTPSDTTLFIDRDAFGIDFTDAKLRTLSGFYGGSCGTDIGTATVRIFSENGCLDRQITVGGPYDEALPPQKYLVQVVDVQTDNDALRADIIDFYDRLGAIEVDLTAADDTLDLIYRAPLQVAITGLPAPPAMCTELTEFDEDGNALRSIPAVPVLDAGDVVPLTITVFEDYGDGQACPVDEGTITVFDAIAGAEGTPVVLEIEDGQVAYETTAAMPNVFAGARIDGVDRSFQQAITAVAEVVGRDAETATAWAVVEGTAPRTATFVTAPSEPIPMWILHDPPGDHSYSFIETGSTICKGMQFEEAFLISAESKIETKVGFEALVGTAFGGLFGTINKTVSGPTFEVELGGGGVFERGYSVCLTTNETLATSAAPEFIGPDADVFVGVGVNFTFAEADRLGVDGQACTVGTEEVLGMGIDPDNPIHTTYHYTRRQLEGALMPQLAEIAALSENGSPERVEAEAAIDTWAQVLQYDADLRGGLEVQENHAFSAGAAVSKSTTYDSTGYNNSGFQELFRFALSGNTEFSVAGNKVAVNIKGKTHFTARQIFTSDEAQAFKMGYVLDDDDQGDFFTVDVGRSTCRITDADAATLACDQPLEHEDHEKPAFIPGAEMIFDLRSGTSSNPWEAGTQPRDRALLSVNPPEQHNLPPDAPAVYTLSLTNAGESQEQREYVLRTIHTANPGGAVLRANGAPIHGGLSFFIGAQQTQEVTLEVERGPNRFSYEDLAVQLYPAGEYAIWENGGLGGNGLIQQADTVRFSAFFEAPCSDIAVLRPLEHWALNAATIGDALEVVLHQFDLSASEADAVERLGLEYRLAGTSTWLPAVDVLAANLAPDATSWTGSWMPPQDGAYDVRAFTSCPVGGTVYSAVVPGLVDTAPPQVFGTPQPADQVLHLGDDIAISFDEPIDCASVATQGAFVNAELAYLDGPDAGTTVAGLTAVCRDDELILMPPTSFDWSAAETYTMEARLLAGGVDDDGNPVAVTDLAGNPIEDALAWSFAVERTGLDPARQGIALSAGWSWFSLNRLPPSARLDSVLAALAPDGGDLVKSQTAFSLYDQGSGAWVGSLTAVDPAQSYQIKLARAATLLVEGAAADPATPIAIEAGWNWIGYLPQAALPVDDALATLDATASDGDIVKSQTAFAQYSGGSWIGSLTEMAPGQGYQLFAQQAGTLTYPPAEAALAAAAHAAVQAPVLQAAATLFEAERAARQPKGVAASKADGRGGAYAHRQAAEAGTNLPELSFEPGSYAHSMTLIGSVTLDGAALIDEAARVWLTDESEAVRGAAQLQYVAPQHAHRVFLMLYSDVPEGEAFHVHVYDPATDAVITLDDRLIFKADVRAGTLSEPLVIAAESEAYKAAKAAAQAELPETFSLSQNYPNPFNPVTTIHYELPEAAPVRLTVFDMLGRQVLRLVDADQQPGRYDVRFDASRLASGVYLYRLEAGAFTQVYKMVLMK